MVFPKNINFKSTLISPSIMYTYLPFSNRPLLEIFTFLFEALKIFAFLFEALVHLTYFLLFKFQVFYNISSKMGFNSIGISLHKQHLK